MEGRCSYRRSIYLHIANMWTDLIKFLNMQAALSLRVLHVYNDLLKANVHLIYNVIIYTHV